jgi:hypothetical protein
MLACQLASYMKHLRMLLLVFEPCFYRMFTRKTQILSGKKMSASYKIGLSKKLKL